jgi:hypothetical protein
MQGFWADEDAEIGLKLEAINWVKMNGQAGRINRQIYGE